MNILITGGAGFIGSNLVDYMVKKYSDYNIINLDKLTYAGNLENLKAVEGSSNYKFIKGDICDKSFLEKLFKDHSIDSVMHLAAESHVDRSILGPEEFIDTNIKGTFNLLETTRGAWADSNGGFGGHTFLHISTDEVYGSIEEGLFTEDSPYRPNSPYAASKASSDHIVRSYNKTYGFPSIITNCSNNYGPYQFPEKLIPLVLLNALEGKTLPVYGDGGNIRDWLYVEDHASALDVALHKGEKGKTYNIGGNNEWKNIDVVKLICTILNELNEKGELESEPPVTPFENLIEFIKDRPGHDRRYAIDSSFIQKELGWRPAHSFEDGIRDTIKWYLGNMDWCSHVRSGEYKAYYDSNYKNRMKDNS